MLVEISHLNRLRVEQDLTYEALARRIGMNSNTLYKILTRPNPKVHDRTLYKIQRFLAKNGAEAA
jgi:predicted transcriptional regulator